MTKTEIYTFVTQLLNGTQIDESLFDTFLDVAQSYVEDARPWVILRKEDATQNIGTSNNFQIPFNLPTDFSRWYDDDGSVVLTDSTYNSILSFREVPYAQRFAYKDNSGVFCTDYINNKIYICGNLNQSYTLRQNYIYNSPLVSSSNTWVFPVKYHKILGLLVAVYWKLGIDYDLISNTQADNQANVANQMMDLMSRWDSNLQNSMTKGLDPWGASNPNGWNAGRLPNI